jgi:DNA-binding transcriptional LysR family regulator
MLQLHVERNLRRVDLNLLVAFDVLMTERSVTRAARRLSVGRSSMSVTLARLRKLFNDPVLIRQGRGLIPTPLAESLATPVRELLTAWRREIANDYLTRGPTPRRRRTDGHLR